MSCNTKDKTTILKHIVFLFSLILSSKFCVCFQNSIFTKLMDSKAATGPKFSAIKSTETSDNNEENDNDKAINMIRSDSIISSWFYPNKNKLKPDRRSFLLSNTLLGITAWNSNQLPPSLQPSTIASAADVVTESSSAISADLTSWPLGKVAFSLLPIAGTYSRRATVEKEVIPNTIWTFDQIQGIVNVNVPVRQIVIKLSEEAGGGLLVHNPVAPTKQLLLMMDDLQKKHGPVRHIILGTVALEHKGTCAILISRKKPECKCLMDFKLSGTFVK